MKKDIDMLMKYKLMDYSLLLAIERIDPKKKDNY
jgi:hypothetical protein